MNDAKPRLSVVIPLYNSEEWIDETIRSVVGDADELLEVLVIDDGSTDRGPELARAHGGPVRVITQENRGVSAARNHGVQKARGALIGFMDSDDIWCAGKPDPRIAAIDAGADGAYGRVQPFFGEASQPYGDPTHGPIFQSLIARRDFMLANPIDESLQGVEDVNWFLRMREAEANLAKVEPVSFLYRQRTGSLAHDRENHRRSMVEQLHASLARRGKVGSGE
jgi:glycosyltransferase involved in cell wall biosynthesis